MDPQDCKQIDKDLSLFKKDIEFGVIVYISQSIQQHPIRYQYFFNELINWLSQYDNPIHTNQIIESMTLKLSNYIAFNHINTIHDFIEKIRDGKSTLFYKKFVVSLLGYNRIKKEFVFVYIEDMLKNSDDKEMITYIVNRLSILFNYSYSLVYNLLPVLWLNYQKGNILIQSIQSLIAPFLSKEPFDRNAVLAHQTFLSVTLEISKLGLPIITHSLTHFLNFLLNIMETSTAFPVSTESWSEIIKALIDNNLFNERTYIYYILNFKKHFEYLIDLSENVFFEYMREHYSTKSHLFIQGLLIICKPSLISNHSNLIKDTIMVYLNDRSSINHQSLKLIKKYSKHLSFSHYKQLQNTSTPEYKIQFLYNLLRNLSMDDTSIDPIEYLESLDTIFQSISKASGYIKYYLICFEILIKRIEQPGEYPLTKYLSVLSADNSHKTYIEYVVSVYMLTQNTEILVYIKDCHSTLNLYNDHNKISELLENRKGILKGKTISRIKTKLVNIAQDIYATLGVKPKKYLMFIQCLKNNQILLEYSDEILKAIQSEEFENSIDIDAHKLENGLILINNLLEVKPEYINQLVTLDRIYINQMTNAETFKTHVPQYGEFIKLTVDDNTLADRYLKLFQSTLLFSIFKNTYLFQLDLVDYLFQKDHPEDHKEIILILLKSLLIIFKQDKKNDFLLFCNYILPKYQHYLDENYLREILRISTKEVKSIEFQVPVSPVTTTIPPLPPIIIKTIISKLLSCKRKNIDYKWVYRSLIRVSKDFLKYSKLLLVRYPTNVIAPNQSPYSLSNPTAFTSLSTYHSSDHSTVLTLNLHDFLRQAESMYIMMVHLEYNQFLLHNKLGNLRKLVVYNFDPTIISCMRLPILETFAVSFTNTQIKPEYIDILKSMIWNHPTLRKVHFKNMANYGSSFELLVAMSDYIESNHPGIQLVIDNTSMDRTKLASYYQYIRKLTFTTFPITGIVFSTPIPYLKGLRKLVFCQSALAIKDPINDVRSLLFDNVLVNLTTLVIDDHINRIPIYLNSFEKCRSITTLLITMVLENDNERAIANTFKDFRKNNLQIYHENTVTQIQRIFNLLQRNDSVNLLELKLMSTIEYFPLPPNVNTFNFKCFYEDPITMKFYYCNT
ncbi:hypothetical protein DLAC_01192 [Tieghemostelium lacteum]|uniref:Uncharacterized protein n=1 Tax=Tieghemostelium lacteum TaxID=361077 RepID=A0A152A8G0_TIELA|nr:hypothetical protein DLAC_01192 [Tieghemostelium lacteum]|eukprot:KYR02357.1 hypothetical protein DLAC_01192 [Tieghemostelium lacteum]